MPSWNEILTEIKAAGSTHDIIRRKYLEELFDLTGRNVIAYYSGWLQKPNHPGTSVSDADKNGFMTTIHGLDRDLGLDLLLHTPGGDLAATESLVDYLRAMFGTDIRVIVPQLALSAGTMISCAASEIVLGKHSSLGPIDPQFGGLPAQGVIEEFKRAAKEIKKDKDKIPIWQSILAKYPPTLIGQCEKAVDWAQELASDWLETGMVADADDAEAEADKIAKDLADHASTLTHARHLGIDTCDDIGLNVSSLEEDQDLQEAVLSVHHCCIHTLSSTPAYKIIESHQEGKAFIQLARRVVVQQ